MNILLYGGGARENALAWKLKQSDLLKKLFLYKANDGFSHMGKEIKVNNNAELAQAAKENNIDLLIVGPEAPLVEGVVNEFQRVGIKTIGPDKYWAMLEDSKAFAKNFMEKHNIPTGKYETITEKNEIEKIIDKFSAPYVLKADGLAAGKGVVIVNSKKEAIETANDFLDGKFNEASKKIIIEEFLDGNELSLISIWDGKTLLPLIPARDYKKLLEENKGPNTGGMGAYCPVDLSKKENEEIKCYINKLQKALKEEKADFYGIIYSGLISTKDGIKVLEYNMRFGDPETQPLMLNLDSDLLEVFVKATRQELDKVKLKWKKEKSFCVVVSANGYPEKPKKNCNISNLEKAQKENNVEIFFAGVKKENNELKSNGGRVFSICKTGINALQDIYNAIENINFDDKQYRRDIGE